jgi:DNA polymerase-3 subunit epsilon
MALLDSVLEDRWIEDQEGEALVQVAERWDIAGEEVQRIHLDYLERLGDAALADGMITDCERKDLEQVAMLLGLGPQTVGSILEHAAERRSIPQTRQVKTTSDANRDLVGKRVCFTGECLCLLRGEPITREIAAELAMDHGMIVAESVTKTLDLLVVADPLTQSGKAKKARQYGIRIMHEPVFWRALGLEVS